MVENIPMLFVVKAADNTDGFDFFDIVNFFLAGRGFEVADDVLQVELFDEVHHDYSNNVCCLYKVKLCRW